MNKISVFSVDKTAPHIKSGENGVVTSAEISVYQSKGNLRINLLKLQYLIVQFEPLIFLLIYSDKKKPIIIGDDSSEECEKVEKESKLNGSSTIKKEPKFNFSYGDWNFMKALRAKE